MQPCSFFFVIFTSVLVVGAMSPMLFAQKSFLWIRLNHIKWCFLSQQQAHSIDFTWFSLYVTCRLLWKWKYLLAKGIEALRWSCCLQCGWKAGFCSTLLISLQYLYLFTKGCHASIRRNGFASSERPEPTISTARVEVSSRTQPEPSPPLLVALSGTLLA